MKCNLEAQFFKNVSKIPKISSLFSHMSYLSLKIYPCTVSPVECAPSGVTLYVKHLHHNFTCECVHLVSGFFPGLVCMKSSTSVVELVMLLCSQVSFSLPLSPASHNHPLSFLPFFVVMTPWMHISASEEKEKNRITQT